MEMKHTGRWGMGLLGLGILVLAGGGCKVQLPAEEVDSRMASKELVAPARVPQFSVELSLGSTLVYRERPSFGIFQVESGFSYVLTIDSPVEGAAYRLSIDGGPAIPLQQGANAFPSGTLAMPAIGNHAVKIESEVDGVTVSRNYSLEVSCPASVSGAISLNANAITVTSSATNVYNYSAPAIATGGIGPFDCAWDFNGDGVRDSAFASCNNAVRAYSNHVDTRKVRVFVRDRTCNKTMVAEADRDLTAPLHAAVLGMKPNLFVTGSVSSTSAGLVNEPQVTLRHLSTNPPATTPARVTCNYSRSGGKGTFSVQGLNTYGLSSSRSHGLSISINNIDDTIVGGVSGSLSAANAKLQQVTFSTDESPDLQNRMVFQGGAPYCQLLSAVIEPKNVAGVPCATLGSGIASDYIVALEASFQCTGLPATTASGPSINIQQGAFYCEYRLVDQCVGGGGGGGGGVDPIRL